MTHTDLIYKNSLPLKFYFFRLILLAALIILFIVHADYQLILLYFAIAFLLSLNSDNYIIEVYNDKFNLILPSIYGDRFADKTTFYFDNIADFKFEKGYHIWKNEIFSFFFRILIPFKPFGISTYKYPAISFVHREGKQEDIKFAYNQDALVKAIELIDQKIKSSEQKKYY